SRLSIHLESADGMGRNWGSAPYRGFTGLQTVARDRPRLPLPSSPFRRVFASLPGIPARPPVVATAARGEPCHAARHRDATQQDGRHPIETVVDHGMAGITWIKIDTNGPRRPVTRDVERI